MAKATQVRIMKSVNRLILTIWLALIASVCITVPSSAQTGDVTARSAQIAEQRQAMLGYLNDASSARNAYPAFWGPFALIGEGARALESAGR